MIGVVVCLKNSSREVFMVDLADLDDSVVGSGRYLKYCKVIEPRRRHTVHFELDCESSAALR